jgi:hypothetical protein
MQLVASGVRSTAQIPATFVKPSERALPTVVQRSVTTIAVEVRQRHLDVAILDAVRLLEEVDLTITIDALDGARHDRLVI